MKPKELDREFSVYKVEAKGIWWAGRHQPNR